MANLFPILLFLNHILHMLCYIHHIITQLRCFKLSSSILKLDFQKIFNTSNNIFSIYTIILIKRA